jgi:hypothetical protein
LFFASQAMLLFFSYARLAKQGVFATLALLRMASEAKKAFGLRSKKTKQEGEASVAKKQSKSSEAKKASLACLLRIFCSARLRR